MFLLGQTIWAGSLEQVIKKYSPKVESKLKAYSQQAQQAYPPDKLAFIVLKQEKRFEVWGERNGSKKRLHTYPITAASGTAGPKLKQGDGQVPEGIYRITLLNPASQFHLSMRVDYPNAFDREKAKQDKRTHLGGDIFIHGSDVSIGCIALGDAAIEELFVLTHRVGIANVKVIIMPYDMRAKPQSQPVPPSPSWLSELYGQLRKAATAYQKP